MKPGRKRFFVTGTDTGVGKTFISCGILEAAAAAGLSTAALKPVAAGADLTKEGLRNDDALALRRRCSRPLAYEQVNPFCFPAAIAPHVAAARTGHRLGLDRLAGFCRGVLLAGDDLVLIEGAGGWKVPLNEREFLGGLARELRVPVILVVGMRLGCLNHALLSAQAILADAVELAGWIANQLEPAMPAYAENLETLRRLMPAPMLAEVKYRPDQDSCADDIDLDKLFSYANP